MKLKLRRLNMIVLASFRYVFILLQKATTYIVWSTRIRSLLMGSFDMLYHKNVNGLSICVSTEKPVWHYIYDFCGHIINRIWRHFFVKFSRTVLTDLVRTQTFYCLRAFWNHKNSKCWIMYCSTILRIIN